MFSKVFSEIVIYYVLSSSSEILTGKSPYPYFFKKVSARMSSPPLLQKECDFKKMDKGQLSFFKKSVEKIKRAGGIQKS